MYFTTTFNTRKGCLRDNSSISRMTTGLVYNTTQPKLTLSSFLWKHMRTWCDFLLPLWMNDTKLPSSYRPPPLPSSSRVIAAVTIGCELKAYNLRLTRCSLLSCKMSLFELLLLSFMKAFCMWRLRVVCSEIVGILRSFL